MTDSKAILAQSGEKMNFTIRSTLTWDAGVVSKMFAT
jgi:hypothetical protein